MGFISILSYAHKLVEERVRQGDIVIDATIGNGVDTLFLSRLAGKSGTVYGFDIQQQALEKAREKLQEAMLDAANTHLVLQSHAEMLQALPGEAYNNVSAIMFNLGFLPGSDHSIITGPESTIPALEASISLLKSGGILTIILYSGHEGGQEESEAVMAWAGQLPQKSCQVLCYRFLNQKNHPPFLIAVEKR